MSSNYNVHHSYMVQVQGNHFVLIWAREMIKLFHCLFGRYRLVCLGRELLDGLPEVDDRGQDVGVHHQQLLHQELVERLKEKHPEARLRSKNVFCLSMYLTYIAVTGATTKYITARSYNKSRWSK